MALGFKTSIMLFIMIYSCNKCFCGISINNESGFKTLANKFSDFVLHFGNKYFKPKPFANVIMPRERDNIFFVMDKILKKISYHWIVITNETYQGDFGRWFYPFYVPAEVQHQPDVYVIPVYDNFVAQIMRIEKDNYFNPRGIFILVLLTDHCGMQNDKMKHAMIFNTMWSRNVLTVNLFILSKCDLKFTLVNAQPFSTENTCRTVQSKGLKYFQEQSEEKEYFKNYIQYDPVTFNGCNFWAGTIPIPPYVIGKRIGEKNEIRYEFVGGIEIEFMRILSRKLNFTYMFSNLVGEGTDAWFKILPNGKTIGFLQDVLDYRVDIIFGGLIPSYLLYYQYQYSFSYMFSSLNWYINNPNIVPQWKIIFHAFSIEIWVLFGFVYLTICFLYWILEHFRFFGSKPYWECDLNKIRFAAFFSIGLGVSCTLNPKYVKLRLLFALWAMYSFHVYTAYTSVLLALMTHPPLEKEIKNIQDLKNLGLKTGISRVYLYFFEYIEIDSTTRSVLDNSFECPHIELCLQQLIRYSNFSVVEKKEKVESIINLKHSKVHKITESLLSYNVHFITSKGNPLGKGLNELLLKTIESGILKKWESDIQWSDHNHDQDFEMETGKHELPLSIRDMQGAFSILMNGLFIAFLFFVGEISFNFLKNRETMRLN